MNEIVKVFNDHPVRIMNNNGEPWFIAKDVCSILGLTNPTEALRSLDGDEKNTLRITEGIQKGNPNVNIISESGLYKLIMRSRKPAAKKFVKWVTKDVLPSIRKTGAYVAPNISIEEMEALKSTLIEEIDRRLHGEYENRRLKSIIKTLSEYGVPRNFLGAISKATGRSKDILVRAHVRGDSRKHKSSEGKFIQLLLPFLGRECDPETLECMLQIKIPATIEAHSC